MASRGCNYSHRLSWQSLKGQEHLGAWRPAPKQGWCSQNWLPSPQHALSASFWAKVQKHETLGRQGVTLELRSFSQHNSNLTTCRKMPWTEPPLILTQAHRGPHLKEVPGPHLLT